MYHADIHGMRVPIRMDGDELAFELPGQLGRFRGKPDGKNFLGHWYRFATPVNGNGSSAPVFVSPVLLKPDGANRWHGDVAPLQDEFTFFLLLTPSPDGSFAAVLRNPEFDLGTQQRVERLVRDGSSLRLIGRRGGKERDVSTGTYDAENDALTLVFPGRGGSYDFQREGDDSEF